MLLFHSIRNNSLTLFIFALISTGAIALTHWLTQDKIESEKQAAVGRMIAQVVTSKTLSSDVYHDCILVTDAEYLGTNSPMKIFRVREDSQDLAAVITAIAPNGYSGTIEFVIGIGKTDNTITGVRVIAHNETPGLGDKIESTKSAWIHQFTGKSLDNPKLESWAVKKDGGDFDALTGATITPRALIDAVAKTQQYFQQHKASIFSSPSNCEEKND
ncbi:MAG: electron transport complex subunit RsxG [Pseudomonadota bacterium]